MNFPGVILGVSFTSTIIATCVAGAILIVLMVLGKKKK